MATKKKKEKKEKDNEETRMWQQLKMKYKNTIQSR